MNFVGNKVICVCVQVRVSCAADTYLSSPESYWRQTLVSLLREIFCCATSHLPVGVYQRRAGNHYHHLGHKRPSGFGNEPSRGQSYAYAYIFASRVKLMRH